MVSIEMFKIKSDFKSVNYNAAFTKKYNSLRCHKHMVEQM